MFLSHYVECAYVLCLLKNLLTYLLTYLLPMPSLTATVCCTGVACDDVAAAVRQGGAEGPCSHDQPLRARRTVGPSRGRVAEIVRRSAPAWYRRTRHSGHRHARPSAEVPEKDPLSDR